jgi:transcriptional regulator with GAF, ATPase, and Fis domain
VASRNLLKNHEISCKLAPMTRPTAYQPQFEPLKALLLELSRQSTTGSLLGLVVNRLAERRDVALARIWLSRPGDICSSCDRRGDCPDRSACLHLVSSAGRSSTDETADWSGTGGFFRRFPLGVGRFGRIASQGETLSLEKLDGQSDDIARPDWVHRESIRSFGGEPLLFDGKALGVLAVFTRVPLARDGLDWLRAIADHTAHALARVRVMERLQAEQARLRHETVYLRRELDEARSHEAVVAESAAMKKVVRQIEVVAPTDASVLILGEPGTGKELVAQEIHRRSKRGERSLIRFDCSGEDADRAGPALFGDAASDGPARLELANGGTLLLDQVGRLPLAQQNGLMQLLQEGSYRRAGEGGTHPADVRIIATSDRELEKEIEAGRFRRDLYFRLGVVPIELTPLRGRPEDLPALAELFLERAARKRGKRAPRPSRDDLRALAEYEWPGNVDELRSVIDLAVLHARGGKLRVVLTPGVSKRRAPVDAGHRGAIVPEAEMRRRERANILAALGQTDWKIYGRGGAAELLGLKPTTLASRIKKLRLNRPSSGGA